MTPLTRRGLIRQTSLGAVAAGALLALPGLASAHAAPPLPATDQPADLREPLAAYVRDAAAGEIALFLGTREIVIHDPALVRRLIQAAR